MKFNQYTKLSYDFKLELFNKTKKILDRYKNLLTLSINDVNLLEKSDNCISSSTAIGFCLEEFLTYNLINLNLEGKFKFIREEGIGTQNLSYDFYSEYNGHLFYVNVKANKSNNDAISALNQLYNDYVLKKPTQEKHFLVFKLNYELKKGIINIKDFNGYFLEEINFSNGYNSDNRNWSKNFNKNSGRLQVSKKFKENNSVPFEKISYEETKKQLELIFSNKIQKIDNSKKK